MLKVLEALRRCKRRKPAATRTSVFDVAEHILASHGEMTAMKLHKLCYYAQAWHLAWDGEALFEEEIQAWANGPVVPALYEAHRGVFKVGPGFFTEALKDADVQHRIAGRLAEQESRAPQVRPQ